MTVLKCTPKNAQLMHNETHKLGYDCQKFMFESSKAVSNYYMLALNIQNRSCNAWKYLVAYLKGSAVKLRKVLYIF